MVAVAIALIASAFFVVRYQAGYSPPGEKTEPWMSDVAQLREALYGEMRQGQPTIWIVSGSNALYGTASAVIAERTGYQVRNYALHAGMHPDLLFSQIRGKVRPGDIVVAPLEWQAYNRPLGNLFDYSNYLHHFSGQVNPDAWTLYRLYSSVPLARWVDGFLARARGQATSYFDGPDGTALLAAWKNTHGKGALAYTYEAVSPVGDINLARPMSRDTWTNKSSFTVPDELSDDAFQTLARWHDYFTGQGARFVLTFPVMVEGNNDNLVTPEIWQKIEHIRSELADTSTPLICDPMGAVLSSLYRLDTIYHLNESGARYRSAKLADCLAAVINGEDEAAPHIDPVSAAGVAAKLLASQRQNFGDGAQSFQIALRELEKFRTRIELVRAESGRYPNSVPSLPSILTYDSDGTTYHLYRRTDGSECTVVAANWPALIPPTEIVDGDPTRCSAYGFWSE